MNAPSFLKEFQAASYIGISIKLLQKMRYDGEGPNYARIAGRIVYRREDLDKFVEDCLVKSMPNKGKP